MKLREFPKRFYKMKTIYKTFDEVANSSSS